MWDDDDPECRKTGKHYELEAAHIRKSEMAVQQTLTAFQSFTNPFTITNKDRTYSLAFGAPVAQKIKVDVLQAEAADEAANGKFIKDRFQNGSEMSTFDSVKKQKLLTMEACNKKVMLTSTQGKVNTYKFRI